MADPDLATSPVAVGAAVRALIDVVRILTDETWRLELPTTPALWLVTRGAVTAGGTTPSPGQAALWGVLRTVAGELPQFFGGLLDLDPKGEADWNVARRVILGNGPGWWAVRDDTLHRARCAASRRLAPTAT